MNNREAEAEAKTVHRICRDIAPMLAGHPARVQGAVLADLLAMWLAGHMASTSGASDSLREDLLAMHIEAVRALVPVNVEQIRKSLS